LFATLLESKFDTMEFAAWPTSWPPPDTGPHSFK